MFSGIVRGCYTVLRATHKIGHLELAVGLESELIQKLEIGSSVSVNGVCLTVTNLKELQIGTGPKSCEVLFDVISESIKVTNLKDTHEGDLVNIELSISTQSDISGHIVSGHVDGVATIISIDRPDQNNYVIRLGTSPQLIKYIFPKGFLALNGCSLTIGAVDRENSEFIIYLIPETLRRTNISSRQVGDKLNLEVEKHTQAIVDTVNHFLEGIKDKLAVGGISPQTLEDMLVSHLAKGPSDLV